VTRFVLAAETLEGRALLSTLVVGKSSLFATIGAAVAAAAPGDTIAVQPGTYREQVTVPAGKDNLTIESIKPQKAIIAAPQSLTGSNDIVLINGAHNVTLEGFTITGPSNNILAGVHIDNGGSGSVLDNHITQITFNPFNGVQTGIGVLVTRGSTALGIDDNQIDHYQKGGIVIDGAGTSARDIGNNEVKGVGPTDVIAQNGIQVSRGASAFIHDNDVRGNIYTGTLDAASSGIILVSPGAVTVTGNQVRDNDYGIYVSGATNPVLTNNKVSRSTLDGIDLVDGTTGALVRGNESRDNGLDGIFVDATSIHNTITGNNFRNNGQFDADDESTGNGTAGTGNTWTNNSGNASSPPGLVEGGKGGHGRKGDHRHHKGDDFGHDHDHDHDHEHEHDHDHDDDNEHDDDDD